jgi:transposase-like protein
MMEIERCSACKRPYSISEIGGGFPGGKESEPITCPHCAHTYNQRSSGTFRTHALSEEQEKQYNDEHPI